MIFTKNTLIEILKKNFNYKIVNDEIFGKTLELNARVAYRFCLTTNTYYLVDEYGLRLFGRFRTFNHRDYSLNPGLFLLDSKIGEINDKNLPIKLFDKHPFIFNGTKRLIFVKNGKNPEDYIINLIHEDGSQWEHYFEFIASELFIKNGYLTDIQLPWNYHGKPDFGTYKHKLTNVLKSINLIENGALILELSALRIFNKNNKQNKSMQNNEKDDYKFIVGEVKSKQSKSRILDYLKTGICFKGYEFIPSKKTKESFCGLIKIDQNNKIIIEDSPINKSLDHAKVKKDLEWFDSYLKIHLLGNLELSEIRKLCFKEIHSKKLTFSNLIKLIKKLKISKIIEIIKYGI